MWRSSTAWPYKLVVALVWLMVPLAAWLLSSNDYQRYQQDLVVQRAECARRYDLVATHNQALADWARRINALATHEDYERWVRHLAYIEEWYDAEAAKLRQTAPVYPSLSAMLKEVTRDLEEQQAQLKSAAINQDSYLSTNVEYQELLAKLNQAQARLRPYWDHRTDPQYAEDFQEVSALTAEYDRLSNARSHMFVLSSEAQTIASGLHDAIVLRLSRFDDLARQDEQQTYGDRLKQRLAKFELRAELRRLLQGEAVAQIR